jgi:hypothetical protein
MRKHATERFKRASQSVITLPWFARLTYDGTHLSEGVEPSSSRLTGILVQNLDEELSEMQYVGKRFAKTIEGFQCAIQTDEADGFELGLSDLGRLLGYKAYRLTGQAEPDSVWSLDNQVFFLFEAKSDETPTDPISVTTCRQAQGHAKWLKSQGMVPGNADIVTIVISPRTVLAKEALPHTDGLFFISVSELRALADTAVSNLRSARSKASDLDVEDRISVILDTLNGSGLTHEAIYNRLCRRRVRDLKTR